MIWIWLGILLIVIPFGVVNVVGAPYLPTLQKEHDVIFKLANLKKGDLFVDLGSGDGTLLISAAQRGYRAVGFETNPYLYLVSKWRLRKYNDQATVYMKNFWKAEIPNETQLLYVFLRDPFMKKLATKLKDQNFKTKLISYAYELPGKKPLTQQRAFSLYDFS